MNLWTRKSTDQSLPVQVGAASDVGRVRDENEDSYGVFPGASDGEGLFVVADGMGGHVRGAEASSTAVEAIRTTYFEKEDAPVGERLRNALEEANRRVHRQNRSAEGSHSMGTTATTLVLEGGQAYLGHVGDSRAYRFGPSDNEQLTADHTVAESMRRNGMITAEEARTHPRRGTLTRAIGIEDAVEVDVLELGEPDSGDCFLLCSDGLNEIPGAQIAEVVRQNTPQDACEELLRRANERGGRDNATAVIIRVGAA